MPTINATAAQPNEADYPHWNRVYLLIVIYTVALIFALALFSSIFTP